MGIFNKNDRERELAELELKDPGYSERLKAAQKHAESFLKTADFIPGLLRFLCDHETDDNYPDIFLYTQKLKSLMVDYRIMIGMVCRATKGSE